MREIGKLLLKNQEVICNFAINSGELAFPKSGLASLDWFT